MSSVKRLTSAVNQVEIMPLEILLSLSFFIVFFDSIHAYPMEEGFLHPNSSNFNTSNVLVNLSQESKQRRAILELNAINFIKENRKIDSLRIKYPTSRFLYQVNKILTNLKKLSLISNVQEDSRKFYGGEIRMKRIKELSIENAIGVPKSFLFYQLQSIKLVIDGAFDSNWLRFLTNQVNSNLNKLEITVDELPYEYFLFIPKHLKHLKTVNVSCPSIVSGHIKNFFEQSKHLEYFEFNGDISEYSIVILQDYFKYSGYTLEVDQINPELYKIKIAKTGFHENVVKKAVETVKSVFNNYINPWRK